MDQKITDFLAALDDFADAAATLAGEWERASDVLGDEAAGYPFPNSFDEVAYSIRLWAETARKASVPALEGGQPMAAKIVSCRIGPYPRPMPQGLADPLPSVTATFDDGATKDLFTFYPDELSFAEGEFIGLTEEEARQLRGRKDVAYLRS